MRTALLKLALVGASILSANAASALDQVTMQLGWVPGGERSYYYLAREAGFFAAENLEVRIIGGKGAADSLTKVATGGVDFAEGGLDALLSAKTQNEVPVKAMMPLYTIMPDALLTTTTSGIKSLRDLEGKSVATSPFTSSNGPWPFLLKMNGVDPDKVRLIKAEPTALAPMLATGQVDAIIQFSSAAFLVNQTLRETKKEVAVIPWAQYGLEGYSNSLYVSDKTLATRRDVAVRFARAVKKAVALMRENPSASAAALKKSIPEADIVIAEAAARAALPLLFSVNTERDGLGVFSPALVQKSWEWVVKQQNVAMDKLNPMQAVDLTIAKN